MYFTNKIYILLFLVVNITFSQNWITTDITNFATIDFPEESELIETQNETIRSVTDNDAAYLVIVKKLNRRQISELTQDEMPNFYEGAANGIIEAAKGKLLTKKQITINGITGLELEYIAKSNPELPALRYNRIFLINKYFIQNRFLAFNRPKRHIR